MQRDHIHSNLLEQIVSIFMPHQNLSASIKWKPIVALPEMNVQMQLPNTLPYMTEVMTCTFSLRLQTVMHTHTLTGMRVKTLMWIPAEEGRLHLGFVHSLIKRPSWKQKCANHADWKVPKQAQGITTTGRTLDLWSTNKPQMLSETIVISNFTQSVMLWGTALVQLIIKNTPTGTASLPMQTAPSALALIVRFTYSQAANTLKCGTWL
jgi:hypothetical protein